MLSRPRSLPRSRRRSRARSRLRAAPGLLLALLLALLVLGAGPASASGTGGSGSSEAPEPEQACSAGSVSDSAKSATAVFTGTVESVVREEISAQDVDYLATVDVDRVYKPGRGSVIDTEEVELLTQRTTGGCSLGALTEGERYVVFATLSDDVLLASGDSGTTLADAAAVTEVEDLLGTGRPAVAPEPATAGFGEVEVGAPGTFTQAAVPGAVLVLVGLLGLLVLRRLGRPD